MLQQTHCHFLHSIHLPQRGAAFSPWHQREGRLGPVYNIRSLLLRRAQTGTNRYPASWQTWTETRFLVIRNMQGGFFDRFHSGLFFGILWSDFRIFWNSADLYKNIKTNGDNVLPILELSLVTLYVYHFSNEWCQGSHFPALYSIIENFLLEILVWRLHLFFIISYFSDSTETS